MTANPPFAAADVHLSSNRNYRFLALLTNENGFFLVKRQQNGSPIA